MWWILHNLDVCNLECAFFGPQALWINDCLLYIAEIAITARHAAEGYLSDSDLSDSCSEYNPSESDRSLSSEDESVGHEDEAVQEPKYQSRRAQRLQEMEYVSARINYADR